MAKRGRRSKGKYAAVGYVVMKVGVPIARRAVRKKARAAAKDAAAAPGRVARANPAKAGAALGALLGAGAWLASRRRSGDHDDD